MIRCVNLDWLECYCLEPAGEAKRDAEFFRQKGYIVSEREYGTRVYEEMFTLMANDSNLPFIEIRRCPKGNKSSSGVFVIDPFSCHIRLCNRTCYYDNAAAIMQEFIRRYHYHFQRISRVDVCLDFERFDYGDDPARFIRRYVARKYAKIYQSDISIRGKDLWDGQSWNSISWGSKKSMISTKLYNKTMELQSKKDKPYIRQAWCVCGLVDDLISMTKGKGSEQYTPTIWRLEFSISSSVKNWFVIEDYSSGRKQLRSIRNQLENYIDRSHILDVFASLSKHYFYFKKFQEGVRKDRCEDKKLFKFDSEINTFYKVQHVATSTPKNRSWEVLLKRLNDYRFCSIKAEVKNACTMLIEDINNEFLLDTATNRFNSDEVTLLRLLISRRIKDHTKPLNEDVETIKEMINLESSLFV